MKFHWMERTGFMGMAASVLVLIVMVFTVPADLVWIPVVMCAVAACFLFTGQQLRWRSYWKGKWPND